jgi:hypothetical protein
LPRDGEPSLHARMRPWGGTITGKYGGEDVLHARVRVNLNEAKARLLELHGDLQEYTGPFDLPDPDEETRAIVQRIVDNDVNHVPTR